MNSLQSSSLQLPEHEGKKSKQDVGSQGGNGTHYLMSVIPGHPQEEERVLGQKSLEGWRKEASGLQT